MQAFLSTHGVAVPVRAAATATVERAVLAVHGTAVATAAAERTALAVRSTGGGGGRLHGFFMDFLVLQARGLQYEVRARRSGGERRIRLPAGGSSLLSR